MVCVGDERLTFAAHPHYYARDNLFVDLNMGIDALCATMACFVTDCEIFGGVAVPGAANPHTASPYTGNRISTRKPP